MTDQHRGSCDSSVLTRTVQIKDLLSNYVNSVLNLANQKARICVECIWTQVLILTIIVVGIFNRLISVSQAYYYDGHFMTLTVRM